MINRGLFRAADLLKIDCPSLDTVMIYFVAHIVRTAGDKQKLYCLRECLTELDQFIIEALSEKPGDKVN